MPSKSKTRANAAGVGKPKREASLAAPTGYAALAAESYAAGLKVLMEAEPKTIDSGWNHKTPAQKKGFIAAIRYAVKNAKRHTNY